jgi:hypothetical protein
LDSVDETSLPQYRIRLFLSVDLVGSTAFKAAEGSAAVKGTASQPLWIKTLRDFYVQFPALIEQNFAQEEPEGGKGSYPRVWKTVGDELIFCCRVVDTDHLTACVNAFLKALKRYGRDLKTDNPRLDVKGAAWLAAFPWPNFTLPVDSTKVGADQFTEEIEASADEDPRSFDFLGNGIDCGFRVATRSTVDRCALSAELAFFLAEAAEKSIFIGDFAGFDRCVLKGVLRERPYPILFLDTERSRSRRLVRHHERALSGTKNPTPIEVHVYLEHFMKDEQIEEPALSARGNDSVAPPASYLEFKKNWLADQNEMQHRRAEEQAAESPDSADGSGDVPEEVKSFVDATDRRITPEEDV